MVFIVCFSEDHDFSRLLVLECCNVVWKEYKGYGMFVVCRMEQILILSKHRL